MPQINYSASWVDVVNNGLGLLGLPFIQALTDSSDAALAANNHLDDTISDVVQSFDWQCLKTQAQIQLCANTPPYKWMYAYQLPSDFGRIIDVDVGGADYEIGYGDSVGVNALVIFTNGHGDSFNAQGVQTSANQIANITYIRMPQDPNSLPMYLKSLIATQLAGEIAPRLLDNEQAISRILKQGQEQWEHALSADSRLRQDSKPMDGSAGKVWNDEHRRGVPALVSPWSRYQGF